MAWEAVRGAGLAIEPISAREVAGGGLANCRLLLVPGGWSSQKKKALGDAGAAAIGDFVQRGGLYLGFCGGAGLALDVPDGLGLAPARRAGRETRLPSLSGPVYVNAAPGQAGHPFWRGILQPAMFHVWWPGQFATPLPPGVSPLALYQAPAPGMASADQAVELVEAQGGWGPLERQYGLRLDPAALAGIPAVVEARLGRGRLILSYLHLDTPQDPWGAKGLANLWREVLGGDGLAPPLAFRPPGPLAEPACVLESAALALWRVGLELGLWRPRHPYMPLWKRGARGLEIWWLLRLVQALCGLSRPSPALEAALEPVLEHGPMVLAAHQAKLAGASPQKGEAEWEAQWFPRPRRTGGELLVAMDLLESEVFRAIRSRSR